ncbi:unnamed protein product [Nippostrongylus brasiliensis]|uniref:Malate dehydrogenase n=1 Tax=Nippostrongylus brasiliensis TaxID=27835 RepID=A0A0N4XCZ6_NIPBR|nr:unnamed protein product [Nippostrongylus brasiliensis]
MAFLLADFSSRVAPHLGFGENVIDGDLCEQFGLMDTAAQREVIEGLDRTTSEISKKLEDIRTRYAF